MPATVKQMTIASDGPSVIPNPEGIQVLLEGIVLMLALLPAVHCASLLAPPGSPVVLISTAMVESGLCLMMVLRMVRWRNARVRKSRACALTAALQDLQVSRLIFDFFSGEIIYYPSWIQHSPAHVPGRINGAVKVAPGVVRSLLSGSEYLFTLEPDDGNGRDKLDLRVNGLPVLSVSAIISASQWMSHSSSHRVNTFVEGPWVQELLELSTEAKERHRGQAERHREARR